VKVLAAMSGGVDSSVAALLLKIGGHEVVGVSMNLMTCSKAGSASCCSSSDRLDAARICEQIGIKHYIVDFRKLFEERVVSSFVKEYLAGRTPSPCILCNEHMKFGALLEEADRIGAKAVATGHYARVVSEGGFFHLLRGVDLVKDQSYFLFTLKQEQLSKILFPIGEMKKTEIRAIASDHGLITREKPESQEICFIPDDDYASFVESHPSGGSAGAGDFVDSSGKILGRHSGIHRYTIGQRRGLGFGVGERQYVIKIDTSSNRIVLGSKEELQTKEISVRDISWVVEEPSNGKDLLVKIRSTHAGERAGFFQSGDGTAKLSFERPVSGVAPGQAAVFYDGDEVIGGGWIL